MTDGHPTQSTPTSRPKRVAVVINPVAGSARSAWLVGQLIRQMGRAGIEPVLHTTAGPNDVAGFLSSVADTCQAVAAVGGDGTIREVVEALIGRPKPILIVPSGTENIVAKDFKVRLDPNRLVETLLRGHAHWLDVGKMNSRAFLAVAGVGFDAHVVNRLVANRSGHITHWDYFWPIWRTFWEHRFDPIRVEADGERICDEPGLVFVGNLARYSVGLRLLHQAQYDDGLLDLCIYRCRWQGPLLMHAAKTVLRTHVRSSRVIYRQCRTIRVSAATDVPVQVDGDPAGRVPAAFTVMPKAALILAPPS